MFEKEFKTLDEQVEILKGKGLTIKDEKYAKEVLLRENYFFLNGYRHLFLKDGSNKNYKPGVRFEELYSLFLFDRTLRNISFKYLLVVENNLKSILSHVLSKKYGFKEKDYLKSKNFTKDQTRQKQVNDLLNKMKRQIRINGSQHSATEHYSSHYGYIPLWILVKVLSFGIVSELYSILVPEDQKEVAKIYNVDRDDLLNYLPMLANYRNLCAYEDILFENKTQKEIDNTVFHKLLKIPTNEEGVYVYGKNDMFALIIILKQMLRDEDFKNMVLEIDNVLNALNYNLLSISVDQVIDRMGFPKNWKDISNIERSIDKNEEEE